MTQLGNHHRRILAIHHHSHQYFLRSNLIGNPLASHHIHHRNPLLSRPDNPQDNRWGDPLASQSDDHLVNRLHNLVVTLGTYYLKVILFITNFKNIYVLVTLRLSLQIHPVVQVANHQISPVIPHHNLLAALPNSHQNSQYRDQPCDPLEGP